MGSYANSLHVKTTDAERVAAGVTDLLAAAGWRPTQKTVDDRTAWTSQGTLRGVHISAPRDGWVSILDTDLMGAHESVVGLAKELSTHAIFFFVDDSDSWSYLLADIKGQVSEFESEQATGDDDDFDSSDFDDGDLVQATGALAQATGALAQATGAIAQLQALMRDGSVLQKFQEVQQQVLASAPPEIRELEARLKRGQGTVADMQQYKSWALQEMPKHTAQFRSLLGDVMNIGRVSPSGKSKTKSKPKPSKAQRAASKQRIDQLCPLLAPGVTDKQVEDALDKRNVFAECVLADFLPLLGISDFYANLSYRYLSGVKESELAAHKIRFLRHLAFETSRPTAHASV
jgi:hypothetical protein